MAEFFAIDTKQDGLNGAIAGFLGDLLEKAGLDAVLVPCKVPYKKDERRWRPPMLPSCSPP